MGVIADGFFLEVGDEAMVLALRDFYRDVVGLELDHDEEGHSTWFKGGVGFHEGHPPVGNPTSVNIRLVLEPGADIDAEAERIKAAGVPLGMEPTDMPWGQRTFTFQDPAGHAVWVGVPI